MQDGVVGLVHPGDLRRLQPERLAAQAPADEDGAEAGQAERQQQGDAAATDGSCPRTCAPTCLSVTPTATRATTRSPSRTGTTARTDGRELR